MNGLRTIGQTPSLMPHAFLAGRLQRQFFRNEPIVDQELDTDTLPGRQTAVIDPTSGSLSIQRVGDLIPDGRLFSNVTATHDLILDCAEKLVARLTTFGEESRRHSELRYCAKKPTLDLSELSLCRLGGLASGNGANFEQFLSILIGKYSGLFLPHPFQQATVNLNGADLSHLNLSEVKFFNTSLEGAKLYGTKLNKAEFKHTNLAGAKLTDVEAEEALFYETSFSGSEIERGDFNHASFVQTDFGSTKIARSSFIRAVVAVDLNNETFIKDSDFTKADFRGAKWLADRAYTGNELRSFFSLTFIPSGCIFKGVKFEDSLWDRVEKWYNTGE